MEHFISAENLAFQYPGVEGAPDVTVFENLNLTIEEGSFTAILGINGCGKSTLAKLFNAILVPSGGKMKVCGLDTSDPDLLMKVRRNVGMVFQNPDNQIVANVVEEDVAFGPENLGIAGPEIRRRVDQALKQVGMYLYREHAPHLLSGGQKQRIAIAGVIAMEPRCIVLDEPTAMLDPSGRRDVLRTIADLRAATPSNAAELAVPDIREDIAFVQTVVYECEATLLQRINDEKRKLDIIKERLEYRSPIMLIDQKLQLVDSYLTSALLSIQRKLDKENSRFSATAARLDALSPLKVMSRGYSIVTKDEKVVISSKKLKKGDRITVGFADGEKNCEVL